MKRRTFLTSTAATLGAGLLPGGYVFAQKEGSGDTRGLRIDRPFHGAVLHRRMKDPVLGEGSVPGKSLKILVDGEAPEGMPVRVNGLPARREGKRFEAEIELVDRETEIIVTAAPAPGDIREAQIRVWWLRDSFPRYRFTVDDTIYCLREIHRKGYKSLFDDDFLGNMKKLHDTFGVKVALNLFYESEDGFNLSQFSDKYKSQWRDNADWLRLLFHARSEFPDRPYENASAEKLAGDFTLLRDEIYRFAGEESYLPVTVVHWGTVRPETYKTLAELGVTVLSGYFRPQNGNYPVSYQLDRARCEYLEKNDFLVDFDSGIVFSKMDMVVNLVPLDRIESRLQALVDDPNTAEFLDLMTHEQYFWPFYKNYLPDHWQRLERAFAFATDRGYKPVFINDPLLGIDSGDG